MLLALGGVSAFPFIIAPLAFSVLKAADLPRQIGAVIMVGCYSLVGYLVPGATNTANIIASQNYGTTLYAGAPIGITCFVIGLVLNIIYVEVMIRTYRKNGVGYTPSPTEVHTSERHDSDLSALSSGPCPYSPGLYPDHGAPTGLWLAFHSGCNHLPAGRHYFSLSHQLEPYP